MKPPTNLKDAIAGPGAIVLLLNEYVWARRGTAMECGVGQIGDFQVVLCRVGEGHRVAMSVEEARHVARYCLATEVMPCDMREAVGVHLAELARIIFALADEAEAMHPGRLH